MDYAGMTRDELRKLAKAAKITGRGKMTRDQLAAALTALESPAEPTPDPTTLELIAAGYDAAKYNLAAIATVVRGWLAEGINPFTFDGLLEFIAVRHMVLGETVSYVVCCKTAKDAESRGPGGLGLQEAVAVAKEESRLRPHIYRIRDEYTARRVAEFQRGVLVQVPTEDETNQV
jgi:hypothetical protein